MTFSRRHPTHRCDKRNGSDIDVVQKVSGPDHPKTIGILFQLADLLEAQGKHNEAGLFFDRALDIAQRTDDPWPFRVAGQTRQRQGKLVEARRLFERALANAEKKYEDRHPIVIYTMLNDLAGALVAAGDLLDARPLYLRALLIANSDHLDEIYSVESLWGLARITEAEGDHHGARHLLERALSIEEAHGPPERTNIHNSVRELGGFLRRQGDLSGARALFERLLVHAQRKYGLEHPSTLWDLDELAKIAKAQNDETTARMLFERILAISNRQYTFDSVLNPDRARITADALDGLGRPGEAKVLRERYRVMSSDDPKRS